MNTDPGNPDEQPLDQERAGALAALIRARKRAEEIAIRTGTAIIQAVDGKPVRIDPKHVAAPKG